jgi:hypothetical protein
VSRFWLDPIPYGDNGIVPVSLPRVDQCQEVFNATVSPWLGYDCAQTFVAGISGMLRRIELNLSVSDESSSARVAIWKAAEGLPAQEFDDFLGLTELVRPLSDGWNVFHPPSGVIAITAGQQYALVLETTTVCDWRVKVEGRLPRSGALCQCFGTRGWEVMWPAATAAFRTYV